MKRPGRPMFRVVLLLLAWATAGAIVNVAVAWGFGMLIKPSAFEGLGTEGYSDSGPTYRGWMVYTTKLPQITLVISAWSDSDSNFNSGGEVPVIASATLIPDWAQRMTPGFHAPSADSFNAVAWEYGWPARSMGGIAVVRHRTEIIDPRSPNPTIRRNDHVELYCAMISNSEVLADPNTHFDARPFVFRPLWPGFAINTVFYAAILWLLFAAPFALRKRRRIKRGLCPKCAYDLRGRGRSPASDSSVCPECGTDTQ